MDCSISRFFLLDSMLLQTIVKEKITKTGLYETINILNVNYLEYYKTITWVSHATLAS